MGAAEGHGFIPDAARRFAAYSNVAGPSLTRFATDNRGATAIEYAVIASLISIVIVGGAAAIGTQLNTFFQSISFGG
jgi:pilus assembly protein Flp/PilA